MRVGLDAEGQLPLLHRRQLLAGAGQHLGQLEPDPLHAGRLLLAGDELAQRPGQPLQVALRRVDVAQRLQRPLVGRVGGQHRLVGLDGLGRVAQLHAHQPAQLVVEPRHLAPVHGGADADAQVRRQLAPPLQLLQQLLERRQRLLVAGPQRQHRAPELDRLLGPPQLGGQRRPAWPAAARGWRRRSPPPAAPPGCRTARPCGRPPRRAAPAPAATAGGADRPPGPARRPGPPGSGAASRSSQSRPSR